MLGTAMRDSRLTSLDALRGLAALSVVFWHAAIIWPGFLDTDPLPGWAWFLRETPLHAAWSGPQAVEIFFVLSGLVLALPFVAGRFEVGGFLVRRVMRLYPAYLVALALALVVSATHNIHVPNTSAWFATIGSPPPSVAAVLGQASMLAAVNPGAYNPVLWSLVVEARVSLVFPLLVWLVLRYPWWLSVSLATFVSVVNTELYLLADEVRTTQWLIFFVAGILIAKHRHAIVAAWRRLAGVARVMLFALAITLYSAHFLWPSTDFNRVTVDTLVSGAGSTLLVVGILSEQRLAVTLAAPALQLLGRVSYSLYLLHAVVLIAIIRLLAGLIPPLAAEAIGLALVLPLAVLCYEYVERPGIRLGRVLSAKLEARMRTNRSSPAAPEPLTR